MKIAAFSDIHGNLRALNTVLERINEKKPDLTVFLGDIFQRGNEEAECLEVLRKSGIVCIKGNCELYLANGVDIDPDVEYLRVYYDSARSKLSDEQMRFVRQMPLSYEIECCGHRLFFSHFLFSDINASYPFHQLSSLKNGIFDKACESEDVRKYDLVAIGHSHQSFVKGNVVSVSASGLENPSFLLIDADDDLNYEVISVDDGEKEDAC